MVGEPEVQGGGGQAAAPVEKTSFEKEFGLRPNVAVADEDEQQHEDVDPEEQKEEDPDEDEDKEDVDEDKDDEDLEDEDLEDDERPQDRRKADNLVEAVAEDVIPSLDIEEKQRILDALLDGDDADELHLTYRANGRRNREPLATLRKKAAGYAGEEEASRRLAKRASDLDEAYKAQVARVAEGLGDPATILDLIEEHSDKALEVIKGLAALATARAKMAEEDPAGYADRKRGVRTNSELRGLKQMIARLEEKLEGRAETRRGTDEDANGDREGARASAVKEAQRRVTVIQNFGLDPDDVAEAYVADGKPGNFDAWFAKLARKRVGELERRGDRHGPSPRRRGRQPAARPAAARSKRAAFPSVKEVDAFLKRRHRDGK